MAPGTFGPSQTCKCAGTAGWFHVEHIGCWPQGQEAGSEQAERFRSKAESL